MKTCNSLNRLSHSPISRFTTVLSIALACSTPAFCGEIHDAASSGDLAKVKALLKDNPELVSGKDSNGWTPLHLATMIGNKDMAKLLLANKAEVNAKNNSGATPLHWAALRGDKDMAELLLANKAEVNVRDEFGATPLHLAAQQGKTAVRMRLSSGTGASAKGSYSALNALMAPDYKDVVQLLLARGADIIARDGNDMTPSYYAATFDRKEVAELLRQQTEQKAASLNPTIASSAMPRRQSPVDCGLQSYPASRSASEILADAPISDASSSSMFAKLAIDQYGKVTHLQLVQRSYFGLGQEFDRLNLEMIEKIKQRIFKPAVIHGEAVPVCADVTLSIHP
jgi:hypothetical protein